jgi:hypothetical protein
MKYPFFAILVMLGAAGCGRPFHVKTAPGLIELKNQEPEYAYRGMSPEGVVFAVRVVDLDDRGDLEFWARAVAIRVHQLDGYALLGSGDVKSNDGTAGRELRFGHDEGGKPYIYTVRLYVARGRLFVVETGGQADEMKRYEPSLAWMQASISLR